MSDDRPYRVVQWATGTIGLRALRGVIEHPNMTLAANRAVNMVASVCAAPPGIRSTIDLPQVIAALG
jgi:4-hydroxy-tetrahydrodipicolinate reductase